MNIKNVFKMVAKIGRTKSGDDDSWFKFVSGKFVLWLAYSESGQWLFSANYLPTKNATPLSLLNDDYDHYIEGIDIQNLSITVIRYPEKKYKLNQSVPDLAFAIPTTGWKLVESSK